MEDPRYFKYKDETVYVDIDHDINHVYKVINNKLHYTDAHESISCVTASYDGQDVTMSVYGLLKNPDMPDIQKGEYENAVHDFLCYCAQSELKYQLNRAAFNEATYFLYDKAPYLRDQLAEELARATSITAKPDDWLDISIDMKSLQHNSWAEILKNKGIEAIIMDMNDQTDLTMLCDELNNEYTANKNEQQGHMSHYVNDLLHSVLKKNPDLGHGVESWIEYDTNGGGYNTLSCAYINAGDSYNTTITFRNDDPYHPKEGQFRVESYADAREELEKIRQSYEADRDSDIEQMDNKDALLFFKEHLNIHHENLSFKYENGSLNEDELNWWHISLDVGDDTHFDVDMYSDGYPSCQRMTQEDFRSLGLLELLADNIDNEQNISVNDLCQEAQDIWFDVAHTATREHLDMTIDAQIAAVTEYAAANGYDHMIRHNPRRFGNEFAYYFASPDDKLPDGVDWAKESWAHVDFEEWGRDMHLYHNERNRGEHFSNPIPEESYKDTILIIEASPQIDTMKEAQNEAKRLLAEHGISEEAGRVYFSSEARSATIYKGKIVAETSETIIQHTHPNAMTVHRKEDIPPAALKEIEKQFRSGEEVSVTINSSKDNLFKVSITPQNEKDNEHSKNRCRSSNER